MSWIKVIHEAGAQGTLKEIYGRYMKETRGTEVANILKIESLDPDALAAHLALYRAIMFGRGDLSRAEREAVATAVSSANGCHY
jgi:alkylhydroperoxidase family enzyme